MLKNKSQVLLYEEIKSAIANRKVEAVKAFIISNPTLLDKEDINGKSLLQIAIIFFCPEIILTLLSSQKIDVNHRDNRGVTALVSALTSANFEAIKLLLQAGAILDTNQRDDELALAVAINKNPEIAFLLEQAARGQLEPFNPLQDSIELDTQIQPDESPAPHVTANKKQEPLTKISTNGFDSANAKLMLSWSTTISGALKHRLKNKDQASSIEMSSNRVVPSQPPSNNHPHAD